MSYKRVLIIGLVDVGNIARSAKAVGYKVFTADIFGDQDVRRISDRNLSILQEYGSLPIKESLPHLLVDLVKKTLRKNSIDAALIASGLDDEKDVLHTLHSFIPIIGTPPKMMNLVRDKIEFFNELKRLNLPFPETKIIHNINDGKKAAQDLGFPLVLKPLTGFGGRNIRKFKQTKVLGEFLTKNPNRQWLIQKYVPGTPASISILASRNKSRILAVTEQLLGIEIFGQRKEFTYCGNIVPLNVNTHVMKQCKEIAEKLTKRFRLKGSNGIDIIVSKKDEKVTVIEVNPRFQGSMECIENYLGINLVEKHMQACLQGEIPKIISNFTSSYHSRAILYAKSKYQVPDLTSLNFVRDIPQTGAIIKSGDPICSVVTHASSRKKCVENLQRYADLIYRKCLR